jgi:dTDP-4-amino-4,6-dideoxygalactose transaminase
MGLGIWPGDAVFVPAFTFVATAEVVAWLGASPVFVDVLPDTFNMDPNSLALAVPHARAQGLVPRVVMPVDLFGQPADYREIAPIAAEHNLCVLADAAQSFGATIDQRPVGTFGVATATSFFPAKPLGCYGDGGAVFTDDDALAATVKSLRIHGQGATKYEHVRIGMNGRFDTIQAAILLEKLSIFKEEIEARQRVAARYSDSLRSVVEVPDLSEGMTSVWAQYTIQVDERNRDKLMAGCGRAGVPTGIYYPLPLSQQKPYARYPAAPGGTPVADVLATRVLSLPMHPYLDQATQDRVTTAVKSFV